MNSKQPSPEPITAKKTGMILYYPRLENAERTSTKPHQRSMFREHNRLGIRTILPSVNNKAQISVRTDYENWFKPSIKASCLWNLLPKSTNTVTSLEAFKVVLGDCLRKIRHPYLTWLHRCKQKLAARHKEKGGCTWCRCPDASPTKPTKYTKNVCRWIPSLQHFLNSEKGIKLSPHFGKKMRVAAWANLCVQ